MIKQLIRFTLVGGIGTTAHYAVLILLVSGLFIHPVIGSVTGFLVGMIINYWLNRRFTFSSQRSHGEAFWRFGTVALVGIIVNTVIMALFTVSFRLHYLISQVIATILTLAWNFLGSRYWVFRETVK